MSDQSLASLATEYANAATTTETPPAEKPVTETAQPTTETTEAAPPPTPQQANRWVEKIKVDGVEEELDLDAMRGDEGKRKLLREYLEKGRSFDTVVKRREQARIDGQREALEWVRSQGFDIQQDPADPKGWKVIARQKAMSATETAPQSPVRDEKALLERAKQGDAEAMTELLALQASRVDEVRKWQEEKRTAEERSKQETERAENAKQWGAHIAQVIKKREASFEGPQAKTLKEQVFRAAWAEVVSNPNATGESVAQVIEATANALDAMRSDVSKRFTTTKPAASTPPVLNGAAPSSATTEPDWDGDPSNPKGLTAWLKSRGHE